MANQVIRFSDYDGLLQFLYDLALNFRTTFNGFAYLDTGGGVIRVTYDDEGNERQVSFLNDNPNVTSDVVRRLVSDGFLKDNLIQYEAIIAHYRQIEQTKHAEEGQYQRQANQTFRKWIINIVGNSRFFGAKQSDYS